MRLFAEVEERFEWNPHERRVRVTLRVGGKDHTLTKFYPDDFLASEFDVLWAAMGEALKEGIRRDRSENDNGG